MANDTTLPPGDISSPLIAKSQNLKRNKGKKIVEEDPKAKELMEHRQYLSSICKPAQRHAADARRRYDYEWMVRDLFRRGYHFSRYQPSTQTVILASRQTARVPVNIIAAQMRSIRNQVTSFRPKFEVLPRHTTDQSETQARYSGRLLDYVYEHLNFKNKIKKTIIQGLMYSIGGPWQIYYDEEKKEVRIWLLDPFDFYFDPLAEDDEDCEYMIKAVRRPISEVLSNPDFDENAKREIIGSEARLAVSEYKQFMIQTLKYVNQYNSDENPSLILFEGSFKVRDDETGKIHIRKVVWTDQNTSPLLWEDTDDDTFDYVIYHADINPNEILGEGWMKHVMPINRVIDQLESSVFDYNYRVAKGRIVVDRDSGVRAIHNVHGEIISKNKGADVRALDMPALPIAVQNQIDRMSRYLEDIGGAHDASLGRVPAGVKSGIGVAELKQADACVDVKTEALTKSGWKKYNELKNNDEIYLFDPKLEKGKWGKVNWIYWNDKVDEDMYAVDTKTISFVTTKDHSWMTFNARGNWKKEQTQTLKFDENIPIAAESASLPKKSIYSNDFVELVAWVITEGTYSITKTLQERGSNDIRIYQKKKDQVEKIKQLFSRLGITRKPFLDNKGCYQFTFANENAEKIRELFPTKSLTSEFVSSLTGDQISILIDTMIDADGCRSRGRLQFVNTNKETIDSFQLACILSGFSTAVSTKKFDNSKWSTRYDVYIKKSPYVAVGNLLKGKLKKIKFTGRIWCPNTETGYWFARRNGKVFITGNTNQDDLVDNMEDFLSTVGQKILQKISKYYDKYQIVEALGYGENEEKYFAVVGSGAKRKGNDMPGHEGQVKIGPDWLDLAIIGEDNNIRVTIGSWLGYTKEALQEKVIKYAQLGLIDQKTALQLLEFGNIDKIVENTRREMILKKNLTTPQNPSQAGQVDQYSLAETENEMIVNEFKDMPVKESDDHYVHISVHQEALGKGNDPMLGKHIELHQFYLSSGSHMNIAPAQPAATPQPQGPPQQGFSPQDAQRQQQIATQQPQTVPQQPGGTGVPPPPVPMG